MTDLLDILAWFVSLLGIVLGAIPGVGEEASKKIDDLCDSIRGLAS